MPGPEDKRTSWGGSSSDKTARRQGKGYQVTGKVPDAHRKVDDGAQNLAGRRFKNWLFGDDD